MKSKKKIKDVARYAYKKSFDQDGTVDPKKVQQNIKALKGQYKIGLTKVLKLYKKLIESALSKEEVILEIPTSFKAQKQIEAQILARTGAKRVIYKLNPKLVFGAKIKHGDWIFDSSLPARLEQLSKTV